MVDIVSAGFEAGIRFGNRIPEDFIAVRLSEELRWMAVASPRYLNANHEFWFQTISRITIASGYGWGMGLSIVGILRRMATIKP
jgi:DNA-binding transcriptional LysR family regulator